MKKQHLLIVGAATVLGAASGAGLKIVAPIPAKEAHAPGQEPATEELGKEGAHKKGPPKAAKKNDHKDKAGPASSSYFKFSRQFVAPVVIDGSPKAMIILDVVVELAPGAETTLYADEPKLRDAVLRALLTQSSNGALASMLQEPALLETTRAAIFKNIHALVGDDAVSVLLMDVGYQPF
ncbi:MAG: hypothetical protein ACKVS5_09145 [Parvularculaceae bacterium]